MANRQITNTAQLDAMGLASQRCAEIIELTLGLVEYRFTNAAFDVTANSKIYSALGDFLGFSDIEETSDMSIASVTITLSGIDPNTVYEWLTNDYIDKPVRIYRVYFDSNWAVIGNPLMLFDGRIDSPMIQDTGTSATVGCKASSQWSDFYRRNGRWTSNELQHAVFPSDNGFQYSAEDKPNLKWGG